MKSRRMSLGVVSIPLAYGTLVLTLVVFCEFAVANLLFESPCGPNKAYRQNILGSAKTARSDLACIGLCLANVACNSFTYNFGNRHCELSSGVEKNCSLLTTEANAIYYEALPPGCVGPARQSFGRDNCTCSRGYYGSNCEINCGDDFFMLPGSGSCYHLSSVKRHWMQAKADCEARGAMLFCPETEEEFTVVRTFLKTKNVLSGGESVFYGVTDTANEGTWVCEGTGKTLATATGPGTGGPLFYRGQPYSSRGDPDCACGWRGMDILIDDAGCSSSRYFLCEKP